MFRQGPFVLEGDAPSEPSSGFGVLISRLDHAVRLVNSGRITNIRESTCFRINHNFQTKPAAFQVVNHARVL